MKRIEQYDDFRIFLKEYFEEKKRRFPHFSHRYFCRKAEISSPSLYQEVVEGKRNLTGKTIPAFIKGLGLTERDGAFFTSLVHFNQSKTPQERELYLLKLRQLRQKVRAEVVPIDQHEYYSWWYNPVVRELVCTIDWNDDYEYLAQSLEPKITKKEAEESVRLLLRLGFIRREEDGTYIQCNPALTTGPNLSESVRNLIRQFSEMAVTAIERYDPSVRHISSMTIGVSRESFLQIQQEIGEFKDRIRSIVDEDRNSDRVYDINVQFFPLSTPRNKEDR